MSDQTAPAEWYYVGHYGQLGPLTLDQVEDLCRNSVIDRETYVWHPGLPSWQPADAVGVLAPFLGAGAPPSPPPPPGPKGAQPPTVPAYPYDSGGSPAVMPGYPALMGTPMRARSIGNIPRSDKSRVTAGLLNFLPGFGRFYLGYSAHGALQLITSLCLVGYLWSVLDAIFILTGGLKYDGYGRIIED